MKKHILIFLLICITGAGTVFSQNSGKEKTSFQTGHNWVREIDMRADIAMIYGTQDYSDYTFRDRINNFKNRGYTVHFMTGIAWGTYQDYFMGEWDGKNHIDEGQVDRNGNIIWHGENVPYVVPTASFLQYMKEKQVKKAIDYGAEAIYLEEPEFWMRGGYSTAFKEEWKKYYGTEWKAQHESPENTYLSNKLKYHLYYNALNEVFTYAKKYARSLGKEIKCYVPTHSLVNYSSWQIVSPEASLASLPSVDGYIAQVWTGTSREPVYYNGVRKERVFENAFLEYGSMYSMIAPTGRKIFFLTDPIEDAIRSWDDYRTNYQATFTSQLLYPQVANYEVMPWPERIYLGKFKVEGSEEAVPIPEDYASQLQVMINTLNDMPVSQNEVNGTHGIGVLMANSLMFQRFPEHEGYSDVQFSNFYGQTLPLLKRGIPVEIVHIENTAYPEALSGLKVLVMSYSNMKPSDATYHDNIAEWVKNGGVLIYCAEDIDPFQSVPEWWNTGDMHYTAPSQHLFELMELEKTPAEGSYTYGKGTINVIREEPKNFVLQAGTDNKYVQTVIKAYEKQAGAGTVELKNNFYLERGPYVIVSVMNESVSNESLILQGKFIDLFDPELPVLQNKSIGIGEQAYLYDLDKIDKSAVAKALCGAGRVSDEKVTSKSYEFVVKGPANTGGSMRVYLQNEPTSVRVIGESDESKFSWDEDTHTYRIYFKNDPDGVRVRFGFPEVSGIAENIVKNQIAYFSPDTSSLHISSEADIRQLEIYSASGQLVMKGKKMKPGDTLMLNNYLPGVYTARITDAEGKVHIMKFRI
ncbi:T9SS type A sorting domain-containing protein [Coprobacter tertius]|uniref:T9SS type A sorting domain-containing protein n=1 Tax=Coprobacter tertius TaxID=2944915 RepID=A0ABT1MIL9_9BACT|nr:T9SS type A sorting domain-containing protein [Coprobacter tertius]MCP9612442.1 T9SS type A sorting domain-containing protein [Coprobacter tertius]